MSDTTTQAHPGFGVTAIARDAEVLDSTIHYVESLAGDDGSRDPIVFLHGNPTSSFLWRHVFSRLEGQGRLLAVDLIGFGDSGKPDIDYSLEDHQRYLDAWFDALALTDVTLVLQDYGAAFGLHWASRHPDRVRAVVLAEPVIAAIESEALPEAFVSTRALVRTPGDGEKFVLDDNRFVGELFPGFFLQPLADDDLAEYLRPFPTPESRKPVIVFPRQLPVDADPASTVAYLDAFTEYLRTSDVPKTLLTYEPGFLLTPKVLKWARATIKNLEVVDGGAGIHFVQEESPEPIADAVVATRARAGF
ncbi:haloalkane dehalogenase [Actinomycetospora aeridis]|uniref:Haloalkane dehalogenase n=1 Tax=Actinomycetospora aeridis TaxID=3129231 RepID=A0ABU8ND53_9PSEU